MVDPFSILGVVGLGAAAISFLTSAVSNCVKRTHDFETQNYYHKLRNLRGRLQLCESEYAKWLKLWFGLDETGLHPFSDAV